MGYADLPHAMHPTGLVARATMVADMVIDMWPW
jgi:hypothetical protein